MRTVLNPYFTEQTRIPGYCEKYGLPKSSAQDPAANRSFQGSRSCPMDKFTYGLLADAA